MPDTLGGFKVVLYMGTSQLSTESVFYCKQSYSICKPDKFEHSTSSYGIPDDKEAMYLDTCPWVTLLEKDEILFMLFFDTM